MRGKQAQPVTDLPGCKTKTVLVTAFDAGRLIGQVQHLLPQGAEAVSLDTLRLPDAMLTNKRNYLDRSEEHTSELQSLMRISYAVFCLKKNTRYNNSQHHNITNDIYKQQQTTTQTRK